MKIAIVGAGAMGSVYAGLLGDAGNEVWAIDTWREHIEAIRANGLRVEGASGDRVVKVNAATEAHEAGVVDLVIIATKAMHVEAAAQSVKPLLGKDTIVLTIQNGLGSAQKVAGILGTERLMIGVVGGFGASMKAPGHAHHNGWELVRLGELNGPSTMHTERIAEVWRGAGFKVRTYDDMDQLVWEKLICNVTFSGTCTVLGWRIREVMADEHAWRIASGCAKEAYAVARARGVHLEFEDPIAYVQAFGSKIPNARPSVLLDHLAHRRSEIEVINGAIPPAAREVNLAAPYNETITALVKAKETNF
ncbi:MAG: 2-dehydropantoate 2-reductase [Acidiferrobacterales bacterium]|nr:2-dehydropantoate 2-reductase [Acidiferrobacterales bacterium]